MKLSERLLAGDGPDRELDGEITFDLYAKPVGKKPDGGPVGYLWPEDNPSWNLGIRFSGWTREAINNNRRGHGETILIERDRGLVLMNDLRVKPFTTSLDAALSLYPLKPDTMPTNPRKAAAKALEQRGL